MDRVLVVDDSPTKLLRLRSGLDDQFEVLVASDGTEALEVARRHHPDVVVSDLLMPTMDGFELCLAIRRDPALASTRVLLISNTMVSEHDAQLAHTVGADRYAVCTSGQELAELLHQVLREPCRHPVVEDGDFARRRGERFRDALIQKVVALEWANNALRQVAALSQLALADDEFDNVLRRAVDTVAAVLDAPVTGLFEQRDDGSVALVAGDGWPEGVPGELTVDADTFPAVVLTAGTPVGHDEVREANGSAVAAALLDAGAVTAVAVPIVGREHPYGVLVAARRERRPFRSDEVDFLTSIANVAGVAAERQRASQDRAALEVARLRQREAIELNDGIVQNLVVAQGALALGQHPEASRLINRSLVEVRGVVTRLLADVRVRPGDFVRRVPLHQAETRDDA